MSLILKPKKHTIFIDFVKGFFIGIGCLIPGLSGGSIAIILGVYERLLDNVSNIFCSFKKSVADSFFIFIGSTTALLLFSNFLNRFSLILPMFSCIFFCVITIISTYYFIRLNLLFEHFKYHFILLGIIISLSLSIVSGISNISIIERGPGLLIVGFILALALVLPGISFSYMMLFLGVYNTTLEAINDFDISFLFFLITGIGFGIFIWSKLLYKLLKIYKNAIYNVILGFILASLCEIFIQSLKC